MAMLSTPTSTAPDMQDVISAYGVQVPTDENISYTTVDGRFYSLSEVEEASALKAIKRASDLLLIQSKLETKLGRAPTLSEWAARSNMTETKLKNCLSVGIASKKLIVATNIPLVYGMVYKNYANRINNGASQLTNTDLIQDGILGLARATELYDVSRAGHARFSTYAWYWIKAFIDQSILASGHTMKMPRRATQTYDTAYRTIYSKEKRPPTEEELAQHLNISTEELYRKYILTRARSVSLDGPANPERSVQEISDGEDLEDDSQILQSFLRQALDTALSPRERKLLSLRFGLEDGRARTLRECSKTSMMSLDATKLLLKSSIAKLKSHVEMKSHKYSDSTIQ